MDIPIKNMIDLHIKDSPSFFINVGVGVNEKKETSDESFYIRDKFEDIKIFGVEPAKNRFDIVKENFPGKLFNIAFGATNSELSFFREPCVTGVDMVIAYETSVSTESYTVQCVTLDSFCTKHNINDNIFLWCDCEGYELKILQGAANLLKEKKISHILLEMWEQPPSCTQDERWAKDTDIIELLDSFGFEMQESYYGDPLLRYDALFSRKNKA
jgi:FkbM family methyltransferase